MDPAVYRTRRQKLLNKLGQGMLLLPTAAHDIRNGDVHYEYRPGSDFHYLCGFPEPQAVLAAWRLDARRHKAVLFVLPRDKKREIWDGPREGTLGAVRTYGADEAHPVAELWKVLPELLKQHQRLFHTLGRHGNGAWDRKLLEVFTALSTERRRANPVAHPTIEDPLPEIARLRLIKDGDEIEILEEAARISIAGHLCAMRAARSGLYEYEVQAELEAEFRRQGSPRNGYPSIVASGKNACVLHYVQNNRRMRNGDLLLLDAGAEYGQYTADITRTYPVSGKFTEPQKAIYKAVLAAQKAGIRAVKPNNPWNAPHVACTRTLTREMYKLGFLRGTVSNLVKKGAVRKWFMHGTSHWLGMDVHDVGAYQDDKGRPMRFRPGMVLTVEPGLYFDNRDQSVPKEFRGIGVRIEDDVLVTRSGNRVLTAAVPKEIREVEEICNQE